MYQSILSLLKNRYVLTTICFVVWMGFLDKDDFFSQLNQKNQIASLQKEKAYFIKQTADIKKNLADISVDKSKLEKLAREKYLMKKDNEEVFVIINEKAPVQEKPSLFKKIKALF